MKVEPGGKRVWNAIAVSGAYPAEFGVVALSQVSCSAARAGLATVPIAGGLLVQDRDNGRLDPAEKGIDPVELRQAKADLYAAERRWPDARAQAEDILKEDPLNGRALLSLGRAYAAEDNLPRATLAFESAAAIKSSTYEASLELANIELKNRHYAKSAEYLQKALNIERSDAVEDDLARVKALVPKES